jgi:hypothetical protein
MGAPAPSFRRNDRRRRGSTRAEHVRAPRCSRCDRVALLDPCRRCATPAELAAYPPDPRATP